MPVPKNKLKAALAAGQVQTGCWLGLCDAYAAEVAGTAGFDWLLIDGEHAPNDLRSTMAQLQVVEASGSAPIVRLLVGETWMIKQALDIGAQSLLIPMVESADEARQLVAATRYPPNGVRGVGAALARASRFTAIPDYVETADQEICLMVQVESRAGIAALSDILQVDGVDGVFIGPADLAADMGFPGQTNAPEVRAVMEQAIRDIAAAGIAPGIMAPDPKFAKEAIGWGATFVCTAIDILVLAQGLRKIAKDWA